MDVLVDQATPDHPSGALRCCERPLMSASRHLDHASWGSAMWTTCGPGDLTQGWTDRGPRRDLSTLCLRPFRGSNATLPLGGATHRTKTPPLITTFVCCAAPR